MFMSLIVLGTSIWMAVDSSRLGYDTRDVKGAAAMGPVGWFFCGLLLWIIAFPLYLVKRPELKAAGERRRALGPGFTGRLPPIGPYGQPQYGQPQYGQNPYGAQPQYGQNPYGAQPQYGQNPYAAQPQYGPNPYAAQPQYGQPSAPPPYGQPQYGQPQYGQAPYGQPTPGQAQAPASAPFADQDQVMAQIVKLGELRAQGILTEEEFQRKKGELLART